MMRRSILALALLLATAEARPEQELETPHITVNGTATIQVVPNEMLWQLNVQNVDPSSAAAAENHGKIVGNLMAFLKQSQIPEKTIRTSRMHLGENWKLGIGPRVQDGYAASTDVQFTLADFTKYAAIWTGLSAIQGVQIRDVLLNHSDRIRYQNEARTKAVLAARDKAQAIAETLGVRIGAPLVVEEDISVSEGYRALAGMATATNIMIPATANMIPAGSPAGVEESALSPGTIPVRARVKATFGMSAK